MCWKLKLEIEMVAAQKINASLIGPGSQQMSDEQNWDALPAPQGSLRFAHLIHVLMQMETIQLHMMTALSRSSLLFQGQKRWRNSLRRTSAQARMPRQSWRNALGFSWFFHRQNGFVRPESAKGPGSAEAEQHAYLSDDLMGDEGMHYMIMICPFLS